MTANEPPDHGTAPGSERPWLWSYDPSVPADIAIPDHTLDALVAAAAAKEPRREAVRFFGHSMSYAQLDAEVSRLARLLRELGVKRGDRVALMLPNCPQMVVAFYGTLRLGAVVVPISPLYVAREVARQMNDSGARVLLCLSSLFPVAAEARSEIPALEHLLVTSIKDYLPLGKRLLFTLARERKEGYRPSLPRDGRTSWLPTPRRTAAQPLPSQAQPDDLAVLQYTGGTTGMPRAAMLTHRNLLANALQVLAWSLPALGADHPPTVLGVIPLFHIYALTSAMNFAVAGSGTLILQPRFDLHDVLEALDHERPDFFPGVPTMYSAIIHATDVQQYRLDSLKAAISGAAALPAEVQRRFQELTGARLVEGYGLTEASPVTHCTPVLGTPRVGTIGVPLPNTDAVIVDQETGTRRLAVGEVGELAVRGPQVMQGYWRDEEATRVALRDGWLLTGDLARMDADGFFRIVDRKKDIIITGGMNVVPREVEEVAYGHPAVREAVAVGVPDERWGEAVRLFVVLKAGSSATEEELIAYCHERLARYKVPKSVEFRTSLPTSLVGKHLRRVLADEARRAAQP